MNIGRRIDRLIGTVAPSWGVKRDQGRAALERIHFEREFQAERERQYAAGKAKVHGGNWAPSDQGVNDEISSSIKPMRGRARQLIRDMPAMATAVNRLVEFTVGPEIILQCRVKDAITGKLDKRINQQIEDSFAFWQDEADEAGRLHFSEMVQLACRNEVETGEYIYLKKRNFASNRYLPFCLSALEPDQFSDYSADLSPGNEIHRGVEYDPRTSASIAYHLSPLTNSLRPMDVVRVPKEQAILGFKTLRPGQLSDGLICCLD